MTLSPLFFLLLLGFTTLLLHPTSTTAIGVNYGTLGNLPPPEKVANFLKTKTTIDSVKIFDVNPDMLRAFANSGISVTVTVPNGEIPALSDIREARRWVSTNILPYNNQTKIKYISVGNEILLVGDDNTVANLVPAMKSVHQALVHAGISDIKVTTAHALNIIAYELNGAPSQGRFRPGWDTNVLAPMLAFHRETKSPFMINPYPYFGFDPKNYNFAIFKPSPPLKDKVTGHIYTNMYDTLVDSTFAAMKALGYGDVDIAIGETGWPSACDQVWCTVEIAQWFNDNVIKRSQGQGTPLMPNRRLDTFIFALFNELLKPGPTAEKNWGLFQPDLTPVYNVGIMKSGEGAAPTASPATAPGSAPVAGPPAPNSVAPVPGPATGSAPAAGPGTGGAPAAGPGTGGAPAAGPGLAHAPTRTPRRAAGPGLVQAPTITPKGDSSAQSPHLGSAFCLQISLIPLFASLFCSFLALVKN